MVIKNLVRKLKLLIYNYKYKTDIHSIKASLSAYYAHNVMISENVVVSSDVSIGKFSYVNRNSSVENCEVGNYCSISSGVWICPYEHHIETKTSHPFVSSTLPDLRKKVKIGNDVLISLNAVILSGVYVGDGAVIAAGAVVTKDIPPYAIVAGVPAKIIKYRFSEEEIKKIQETRWWNKDIQEIKKDVELYRYLRNE